MPLPIDSPIVGPGTYGVYAERTRLITTRIKGIHPYHKQAVTTNLAALRAWGRPLYLIHVMPKRQAIEKL